MNIADGVLDPIIGAALLAMAISLIITFYRIVRGPSLMDRVVALELTASLVAGIVAIYAIGTDEPALIDVAIALALVAFLSAVAFAHYAERTTQR
jgi:multicomponent Na+:H+ antiporter subunit F